MFAAMPRCAPTLPRSSAGARARRLAWALVLLLLAPYASAQSPAPFPQPNLDLWQVGWVFTVVPDGSGGYYVGGNFTHLARQPRGSLAHVLADGSLNPGFAPTVNGEVNSLVRLDDGGLVIGGEFTQVNGVNRANLARLDANGNLVTAWTANTVGSVERLLLDSASTLYIGGNFTQVGGVGRSRLARLDVDTAVVDAAWAPSANGEVRAIALTSDAKVWVGGAFTSMNGQTANRAVRLNASGGNDLTLDVNNGAISQLQVDAADNVYLCGNFNQFNGQSSTPLRRVSPSGASQPWGPFTASANFRDCQLDGDELYLAGQFEQIGATVRQGVARLLAGGALDPNFVVATRSQYYGVPTESSNVAIARTSATQVVVGGFLTHANAQPRAGLAAVNVVDGSLLPAVDAERPAELLAIAAIADGWLVGGEFRRAGDVLRENLLRLNAAGELDLDWVLPVNGRVGTIEAYPFLQEAYVGGFFSRAGGVAQRNLLKIDDADLALVNPDWSPNPSGEVRAIVMDGSNRLYVGGSFTQIGGQPRNRMARVSTLGSGQADGFDPNLNSQVNAIALAGPNAGVYVGGFFSQAAGQPRSFLAVFDSGSTAQLRPTAFNANGAVWSLLETAADEVTVAGDFNSIAGLSRGRLARISDGVVDPLWQPTANSRVLDLQSDNARNLYLGGFFTSLNGLPRSAIGKLSLDGAGGVDENFRPNANGVVSALLVGVEGLTVSGSFTQIGGEPRGGLAAMPFDGQPPLPDAIFADGFEPAALLLKQMSERGRSAARCEAGSRRSADINQPGTWIDIEACGVSHRSPAEQP